MKNLSVLWKLELKQTLWLAWPLVLTQVAQMSLFTTDVIMMGWLSTQALAAGTLATSYLHPFMLFGIGLLSIVPALIAQARGAKQIRDIRRYTRQGLWVAGMTSLVLIILLWPAEYYLLRIGQTPENAAYAATYVHTAVLGFPFILGGVVLRGLIASYGKTKALLVITLIGFVVNAVAVYGLIFGAWGLPRLELMGAGLATTFANAIMFGLMWLYAAKHPKLKRVAIGYHFLKPDWQKFRTIFAKGSPVGVTLMAETGLFATAAMLMGLIGTDEVAAHAVALQCAGLAFMLPLGLAQATTIRVGLHFGAENADGVMRAGYVSLALAMGVMSCTCLAMVLAPEFFTHFFLDPADPAKLAAFTLAVSYLGVAALFQLADGAQVVMASALRGLNDTQKPMIIALLSYWVVGFPVCYYLGLHSPLGGTGIWIGLATALMVAAIAMVMRFFMRRRLGLVPATL